MGLYGKYEGLPWEDMEVARGRVWKLRQLYLLLPVSQTLIEVCVFKCVYVLETGGLPRKAYMEGGEKNKNENICRGKKMRAK